MLVAVVVCQKYQRGHPRNCWLTCSDRDEISRILSSLTTTTCLFMLLKCVFKRSLTASSPTWLFLNSFLCWDSWERRINSPSPPPVPTTNSTSVFPRSIILKDHNSNHDLSIKFFLNCNISYLDYQEWCHGAINSSTSKTIDDLCIVFTWLQNEFSDIEFD